jgi:hypothetical protein
MKKVDELSSHALAVVHCVGCRSKTTQNKTTMTTNPYNGYTNYETWAVKLWLDNDEGSSSYWADFAAEALAEADDESDARDMVRDALQQQHEDALPELSGFAADLLNAAMSEVNWREIAQGLVNEAKENAV